MGNLCSICCVAMDDPDRPGMVKSQHQNAFVSTKIRTEQVDDENNSKGQRDDPGSNEEDLEENCNEEEDEESDFEYEYEDDDHVEVEDPVSETVTISAWNEPSQAAVNMSLRAEQETTGGKRRLASDLYKIMMTDTEEAGFNLEPQSEDSMDKWRIKLFKFDEDSDLHKDLVVLGVDHVELEMSFPDQYPFEPPFVRVVQPRFKRGTGFVIGGALCMELLTSEGWNPVNDIESVIVSIRSILVVGRGRLSAAVEMSEEARGAALKAAKERNISEDDSDGQPHRKRHCHDDDKGENEDDSVVPPKSIMKATKASAGHYSASEAKAAYSQLSAYHKEKGWSKSWVRNG